MIIVDYSGIALASIIINKTFDEQLIRHMILNSLRMYRTRYKEEYGELVLAVDASNNWRKTAFPQYKASRKKLFLARRHGTFWLDTTIGTPMMVDSGSGASQW